MLFAISESPFRIGTRQVGPPEGISGPCKMHPHPYMSKFRARVEGERAYLMRYASLQLRDRAAAEDAVQETLLAALAGEAGFAGRSNLRTWLTGILKHKIIDTIRKIARETTIDSDEAWEAVFDANEHWSAFPPAWD